MKSFDTFGNRTRELPTCSAVPQPTASTRAWKKYETQILEAIYKCILTEYVFNTVNIHHI
jgi:hypothetical protein